jgi:hypothetical protein
MQPERVLEAKASAKVVMTRLALLVAALTVLVTACGTFCAPGTPKDVYVDERTGQPVPEIPEENYGKQWPQKY